jgi:hypothetical protein
MKLHPALSLLLAALICLLMPAFSCERGHPVTPSAVGGSSGSGGSTPVLATGGLSASGGSAPVAGASSTDPGIADLVCPVRARSLMTVRFPLGGRTAPRSMRLGALEPLPVVPLCSRAWAALNPHCLTQIVGSCVGDGTIECLSTLPGTLLSTRANADSVYHEATILDSFKGTWPPTDTGSDTESGWRAAVKLGLVKAYRMTDTLVGIQTGLQTTAGDVGTNWSTEMFTPDSTGTIHYNPGAVEGGHNWAIVAVDFVRRKFRGRQTWGDSFGCKSPDDGKPGYFSVTFEDMDRLLTDGAVAGFPVR